MSIEKDTLNFINQEENMSIEKDTLRELRVIYKETIKKSKETIKKKINQLI